MTTDPTDPSELAAWQAVRMALDAPPIVLEWDEDRADVVEAHSLVVTALAAIHEDHPAAGDLAAAAELLGGWLNAHPPVPAQRSSGPGARYWNDRIVPELLARSRRLAPILRGRYG